MRREILTKIAKSSQLMFDLFHWQLPAEKLPPFSIPYLVRNWESGREKRN